MREALPYQHTQNDFSKVSKEPLTYNVPGFPTDWGKIGRLVALGSTVVTPQSKHSHFTCVEYSNQKLCSHGFQPLRVGRATYWGTLDVGGYINSHALMRGYWDHHVIILEGTKHRLLLISGSCRTESVSKNTCEEEDEQIQRPLTHQRLR